MTKSISLIFTFLLCSIMVFGQDLDIDGGNIIMNGGIVIGEDFSGSGQVEITSTSNRVRIRSLNTCQITNVAGSLFAPISASAFNINSDRTRKKDFRVVDSKEILKKLSTLPITTWNWKEEDPYRHIGAMAQDWASIFGYGMGDKHISLGDQQGVALVAIQELNKQLQGEVKTRDEKIAALESRLERLEKLLTK